MSAITFDDVADMVRQSNSSIYWPGGCCLDQGYKESSQACQRFEGRYNLGKYLQHLRCGFAFGGFKQSGFGKELGIHALELYTQVKSVWINLGS